MMRGNPARAFIAFIVGVAMLSGALTMRTSAQSEFMSGQGFPYTAFDRLPATDLAVKDSVIHLAFAPGQFQLPKDVIIAWVARSARAVATYYGRFPVKSARVLIVPSGGRGVQGGTTWGYRGGAIRIRLGSDANEDDLRRDWIMTHELVHLALPDLDDRYNWLSEGLAVYIEPIARVAIGDLPEKGVWAAMVRDMPKGLPGRGDTGLDNMSSWGRKYWGGAMFCLLADVEIRRQTNNRLGLRDAMRGVLAAGGNHEVNWSMERVLTLADKAVGLDVLTRMHAEMGNKAVSPDLDLLWRELGVRQGEGGVEFDDAAPLAATRAAITQRPVQ